MDKTEFMNKCKVAGLCSWLKSLLGVKKATETHCVLRETGQMPLFFY